jgi:hypothetical protein
LQEIVDVISLKKLSKKPKTS